MRVGTNPNRANPAAFYMPIVLTAVTHLPHEQGYHKERMEVIKTCLRSMTKHADNDYTLIIWDNGSIPALRDWMRRELRPDILIESVNIGKTAARSSLARMLPNQCVFTYTDDDIYFYPNWLNPQMELLNHFPNVAAVTGYPLRTAFRWGVENTISWARENGELEAGRLLPDEWERDFALSVGREPEVHMKSTVTDIDYLVKWKGKKAYCTAHHCQFIGFAGTIGKTMQYDGRAMGDEKPFDIALDKIGLRLATTQRLTRHIGNHIDEELRKVITC